MGSSPSEGRVSLKHVAERAGVSVKTVSNVVNGYAHITDATRARVQQAIDELHYRPNPAARNLRRGHSNVIALALPELDLPYFAELARSVIKAAEEVGWTVLIDQTDGRVEREQLVLDGIRGQLIDGLIFSPITVGAAELGRRRDTTPLVLLGERVYDGRPITSPSTTWPPPRWRRAT
ncbi:LacI family DNA-binding transcriptional regulator [Blastococcus sp. PRF04-17]|uniref:LacI family DNA-binding transcriptional regulator n=1 Tax=Blastococcus sp. PRF04-17 TaxID=2933797 RepID=UPI001FF6C063|nr:LacI family DNA-binding transcriptional regulator [Blastococcus sp. PRF04-17]UOY03151.1 LacI family transcriptional regulator [Blastococcus sp. PRF04-17]